MIFRSLTASRNPWVNGSEPFIVMHRALERNFADMCGVAAGPSESRPLSVRMDVKEDESAFHVTADLPGLNESEIEVTFDDGVLTVRGEKKIARDESKGTWHITERSHGSFARKLSLPSGIDAEKIEARFNKGVLNLTLPKLPPEAPTAKKIEVKTVN